MKQKKTFKGKHRQAFVGKDCVELSKKQYKDWERQQRKRAEEEPAETLKWHKSRQRARPSPE